MREINEIIIHCSDTRPEQNIKASDIDLWHRRRGFDCIGYHFFIRLDGTIEQGRPLDKIGAHCKGHNANSIGICYAGGMIRYGNNKYYTDTRTKEQVRSMSYLIMILLMIFPSITAINGHRGYANKACPSFDVHNEYDALLEAIRNQPKLCN